VRFRNAAASGQRRFLARHAARSPGGPICASRGTEGEIVTRFVPGGPLRLDSSGIVLDVDAIHAGTDVV
jgi:hypothetical protein